MTQKLILLLIPCLLAVGVVACGDDDPGLAPVNQKFAYRANDRFTYDYYERDSNNVRDESSKQVVVWTVLRVGLDTLSRKGVAEIEEVRFEADGTTEVGRSKMYMRTDSDGQVLVYDLVGTVLNRFTGGVDLSAYITQVPKAWVTIGSTNDANARVLMDDPNFIVTTLNNVVIPPIDPFDVKLDVAVRTDHRGAMEVTAPVGTYQKAYVTDTKVFVDMENADPIVYQSFPIPAGTQIISDSVSITNEIDIDAGIVRQESASKNILAANLFPTFVSGYEMELTAVQRGAATTE